MAAHRLHTQLELANTSNVHITSMKVQLEDNVSSYQKGLLSQEGISPLMAYELELDMQQYPVLRVETDLDGQKSAPDGTTAMTVHCLGKPGL